MKDIETIIKHYGMKNQLKKLHEEVYELTEAILDCYNSEIPEEVLKENVTEEMADCFVLLNQFLIRFDLDTNEIDKVMDSKIERQLRRIEKEKELNNV